MLTFMGLDFDNAPTRAAKLKALQDYFKTSDATAFHMLADNAMATTNAGRGKDLVVNSHGNSKVFAGYSAQQFFDLLLSKGFEQGSFDRLYLMACSVGEQHQDNGLIDNFARDLHRILIGAGINIKLYAPRGYLAYKLHTETKSGQTYYVVDKTYIKSPERDYPLSEGLLLVR